MGFFSFIGQTARAAGKTFKHVSHSLSKGFSDPYKLVKNTAHAASGITRPLVKGVRLVNKGISLARKVPGVGEVIDVADAKVGSVLGISPVRGLILAEEGLDTFNKLEGRLQQANSADEFLRQNKKDIEKLLKNPNLRNKALELLRRLV